MQSILIIEPSDVLRRELEKELQKDYKIYSCTHGDDGLSLIVKHHPDGLIINLILQGIDGLYFLEHITPPQPKVIITLSAIYPPHVLQKLMDLGVKYSILLGCPVHTIAYHMRYFMENVSQIVPVSSQEVTVTHLLRIGAPHWVGFDDIRVGVPLFSQDPNQSMVKEFYPAVAILRGRDNWQQVEKAIRDVKEYAYKHRNNDIWKEYFSDTSQCPTNREFIARLADFVK